MEAFLVSTLVVALAEIGDKTQLLAIVLAARYRKPFPVIGGILVATLANHALAAGLGAWITTTLGEQAMRWILGISFLAMAAWTLVPDKLDEGGAQARRTWGPFWTTTLAFFIVEMGDKTQFATIGLAANFGAFAGVLAGSTTGMLAANIPAVMLGERIMRHVPAKLMHRIAAGVFAVLGVLALL